MLQQGLLWARFRDCTLSCNSEHAQGLCWVLCAIHMEWPQKTYCNRVREVQVAVTQVATPCDEVPLCKTSTG